MRPRALASALALGLLAAAGCSPGLSPRAVPSTPAGETGGTAGALLPADLLLGYGRWRELPDAPSIRGKQDDLFFADPDVGWSVNGQGNVYKTTDGGRSWTRVMHREGTYFRAVAFLDHETGFAGNIGTDYYPGVTDTTAIYRTRDGGATWEAVTEVEGPYPKGICNFEVIDARTLVGVGRVGGPSFLVVSRDGGETWVSRDLSDQVPMLIDAEFLSPTTGFLFGGSSTDIRASHSVILATADGGETWAEVFRSARPFEMAWKVDFPTDRVGYVAVLAYDSTATFIKTTDGGRSWQEHPLAAGPYAAKGVGFLDAHVGWIGGERPGVPALFTSDGGRTWVPDSSLGPLVNRVRILRDAGGRVLAGYAIGSRIDKLAPAG